MRVREERRRFGCAERQSFQRSLWPLTCGRLKDSQDPSTSKSFRKQEAGSRPVAPERIRQHVSLRLNTAQACNAVMP